MKISRKHYRTIIWMTVGLLTAVSAFLHFYKLADAPLRSDTIDFFKILSRDPSPGDIFSNWLSMIGLAGQFPFPMASTKFMIDLFNLPVDHFSLRLSSALFGILCVPAAYFLGRDVFGPRGGVIVAVLATMNPILLQATREAYHYPPMILGAFLVTNAMFMSVSRALYDRKYSIWRYTLTGAAGFFLVTWSQPTGWTLAIMFCLVLGVSEAWIMYKCRQFNAAILFVLILIIGLPLVFEDWGLSQMQKITSREHTANTQKIFQADYSKAVPYMGEATASFAWGVTPLRAGFLIVVSALAVLALAHRGRGRKRILLIPVIYVLGYILFTMSAMRAQTPLTLRYMFALAPSIFILLTLGLLAPSRVPMVRKQLADKHRLVSLALVILSVGFLIKPVWASVHIQGKAKPYFAIQEWFNSNLPKGTLVLVDRFYEPWNELKIYPSTNVFYTWTIPNEPMENYLKYNWRQTAQQFFMQNPGAAYLEIHKSYWDKPEVGPWDWPRSYFSHHTIISNTPYIYLSKVGLVSRIRSLPPLYKGAVTEIFYDTREDVLRKAQAQLRPLALYGPEWGYQKLQQPPFLGLRAMKDMASLELYNFNPASADMQLQITGLAEKSTKTVNASSGQTFNFVPMKLTTWSIPLPAMAPGKTVISFSDQWWANTGSRLLVADVRLVPLARPSTAPPVQRADP